MTSLTPQAAHARLRAIGAILYERSIGQPGFGVTLNSHKPGRDISICVVGKPGEQQHDRQRQALREFFAIGKQAKPLLVQLGAMRDDENVLDWAFRNVENDREKVPGPRGGVVEIEGPCDHPYRALALAISIFLGTTPDQTMPDISRDMPATETAKTTPASEIPADVLKELSRQHQNILRYLSDHSPCQQSALESAVWANPVQPATVEQSLRRLETALNSARLRKFGLHLKWAKGYVTLILPDKTPT